MYIFRGGAGEDKVNSFAGWRAFLAGQGQRRGSELVPFSANAPGDTRSTRIGITIFCHA